jgi:hypothetical protein
MNARDLIDYASEDDAVNFRSAMYAAIHDRVSAHIESKKQEIAQGLLNQESVDMDPEDDDNEPGEEDEDDLEEEVSPFSPDYKSQIGDDKKKRFTAKIIPTGTVYSRVADAGDEKWHAKKEPSTNKK